MGSDGGCRLLGTAAGSWIGIWGITHLGRLGYWAYYFSSIVTRIYSAVERRRSFAPSIVTRTCSRLPAASAWAYYFSSIVTRTYSRPLGLIIFPRSLLVHTLVFQPRPPSNAAARPLLRSARREEDRRDTRGSTPAVGGAAAPPCRMGSSASAGG
jgi:hypothetical protein